MMLYGLCFDYLEVMNLLSKPEIAKHLNLRELMQRNVYIQKEIAKRLNVDVERLKLILYNLDVLIDFKPPLKGDEALETYAYALDFSLTNKTIQDFLHNKIHKITTKRGIIEDKNSRWRF
ncbi:hypothetical protein KAU33_09235 [Candidatus Dependentiae bacterium]|nr:hypothetical protein [Candidatus Dependentiae bacterium]